MIGTDRVLGLIPARGGSKGLPRKNVLDLAGKPLIAWSIEAARKSRYVDRLILSSEDEEIAAVARAHGCEVPFRRPQSLATDESSIHAAILHALDNAGEPFDYFVLLQPTSPLRTPADIDGAIELCVSTKAPACIGMTTTSKPSDWMYRVGDNRRMTPLLGEHVIDRRQELPATWVINGAVYVARTDWYRNSQTFLGPATVAWQMPPERSIDIDTRLDFMMAEAVLREPVS